MILPLSIIADPAGGWVALGFIAVFIFKAILAVFGGDADGDVDVDGGDVDADVDVDSDGFGLSSSDIFSLKGFLNFGVGFSAYWALFGLTPWWNAIFAVIVGIITLYLLVRVYKLCMKLDSSIVTETGNALLGRTGTVYSVFDDYLIIQIEVNNRISEMIVYPADSELDIHTFSVNDLVTIVSAEPVGVVGSSSTDLYKYYISK